VIEGSTSHAIPRHRAAWKLCRVGDVINEYARRNWACMCFGSALNRLQQSVTKLKAGAGSGVLLVLSHQNLRW